MHAYHWYASSEDGPRQKVAFDTSSTSLLTALLRDPYYSSVRATPFAFRATHKEDCLYAEHLPSFLMLR